MSKQTYNNQALTEYLLGSLPEIETERFDELSITNDEFAEALNAADKDLVDAYVQGELTGTTLEQFKSYYLASSLRREKVKFAQAFQSLAEKNVAARAVESWADTPDKSTTKRKGSGWISAFSVIAAPRPALQWGTAFAALALLIAGGWLAFENVRLRQLASQAQTRRDALGQREQDLQKELEGQRSAGAETEKELARVREERDRLEQELQQEEAQEQQRLAQQRGAPAGQRPSPPGVSIASFVLAPQMRGVGQIPTVSIPSNTDYVAMRLDLEPEEHPAYRVALHDQVNNQTLWRSNKLKARTLDGGKALSVGFRASLLKPQAVYMLRVSGVSSSGASETVSDYPFKVVK